MIPRLKPSLSWAECSAPLRGTGTVKDFESAFAQEFGCQFGIAYGYGRTALFCLLKTLGIQNREVIVPAYTCSVVAHAVSLSGNVPKFVDISLHDYQMEYEQLESAIGPETRMIVVTHLFGYPSEIGLVQSLVQKAESRYGHKIWIVQDCAHSFGAGYQNRLVSSFPDVALFGLNVSKTITSIFGGMLVTNNQELEEQLKAWRDLNLTKPGPWKAPKRYLYLLAVFCCFQESVYGLTNSLIENLRYFDRFTKAYHLDEQILFPPDALEQMTALEAKVGLVQLRKYKTLVAKRCANAYFYHQNLPRNPDWEYPPWDDKGTFSHYVIRVPDRQRVLAAAKDWGVELGQLIEYSVPHLSCYAHYRGTKEYPNSLLASQQTINLPIHPTLSTKDRDIVLACISAL